MTDPKIPTNKGLILAAVLLCLFLAAVLTRSSANPSPLDQEEMPDMFVAEDVKDEDFSPQNAAADKTPELSSEKEPALPSPSPTEAAQTSNPEREVSPEAALGVWTPQGSSWMFLVNGVPYTGWFYDTDGKTYYFNKDGIMQTGWLKLKDKRYYLDLDGIMQTGDLEIKGKTYHFLPDGSLLEDASSQKKKPASDKSASRDEASSSDKKNTSSKDKKRIALTFDDGPSSFTDRLLDCLEKHNARATFFMVGKEIQNFPDTVKRMAKLGCELGNHTYSHVDLTTLDSPKEISQEIGGTDQLLLELTGNGASVLRPPYGSVNDQVTASVGTPMILWSIDTLDWETLDAQQTVDTVLSQAENGSIILMHDIFETTVEAAEILIPKLQEQGFELVTVHELAAAQGMELKTGIAYGSFT